MGPSWHPADTQGWQPLSKGCAGLQKFWLPAWLAQLETEEELNLKVSGLAGGNWRRLPGSGLLFGCLCTGLGARACFWHHTLFFTGELQGWQGEVPISSAGNDAGAELEWCLVPQWGCPFPCVTPTCAQQAPIDACTV